MLLIGQFATLARVTPRQLRHYDRLGLLTPEQVDRATGYRGYAATQLPRLNRILALQDLGFRLEEIRRLVDDEVSTDELRGMLELKRAQARRAIEEEEMRLRSVEARIAALLAPTPPEAVRTASLPGGHLLSHRFACDGPLHGLEVLQSLARDLEEELGPDLGQPVAIGRGDGVPGPGDPLDLELGWLREDPVDDVPRRFAGRVTQAVLAPVESAIVTVRTGDPRFSHDAYGGLARWLDVHDRRPDGPMREAFIHAPSDPSRLDDAVVELQLPVTAA